VAGSDSEQPDGHGGAEVRVRLLGPVRLHKDGAEIGLGGPGPRTLLAVLATRSGTVVTKDELVDRRRPQAAVSIPTSRNCARS
jgi:hypothetical protein